MHALPLPLLATLFLLSGVVIWIAGVHLTKTTDTIDTRLKLGEAFGGLVLLGIAGTLPDIAVTFSAAIHGHIPIVIGNVVGGIAIQTLVLVILDFAVTGNRPLSYLAGTPILAIEGLFVLIVVTLSLIGSMIPARFAIGHTNPVSLPIVLVLLGGLYLINKWRTIPGLNRTASDAIPGRKHHERRAVEGHAFYAGKSTFLVVTIFLIASVATLIAGVVLEEVGNGIAGKIGMNSGVFAATVIALITSLPEISSGLESVFIGDFQLAFSDIFGGNIFMPALFICGDLIAKKPILSYAGKSDVLFSILGIALTSIYVLAFFRKPRGRYLRLGADSILVVLFFIAGITILARMQS
jgi:cation:H+ antiporter